MRDGVPGPLERAEETRDGVVRIIFAIGLSALLLIGLIEATAFLQILVRPRFPANAIDLGLGAIGSSSLLISLWTLVQVRKWPIWRLAVLSAVSAVLAMLGFAIVIGAH